MKLAFASIFICLVTGVQAQYVFKPVIKSGSQILQGATIVWKEQKKSFTTDSAGNVVITNIPGGHQTFLISYVSLREKEVKYFFPLDSDTAIEIDLEPEEEHEPEVIVTATRTSRTIANTPTRVEVISGEELDEKSNMKPGDIRMLLSESTGIQTQQTSATSYNSSIRIQGLDGRYTQMLRDGYPLYSGFSGGLSIMQIAPLDLKQVEVIKGSSSTLYGGGAIAGLVNLVSKTPTDERELSVLTNATSARGLDLSGFYSERFSKMGITMFASANYASPYDPAGIGLTAIPKSERYTIHPRLFFYGKNTIVNVGINYVSESRTGGNLEYIKNGGPGYFEKNNSNRYTIQVGMAHQTGERSSIQFKSSYTEFDRAMTIPSYRFEGVQQSTFTELSYNIQLSKSVWVLGGNFLADGFNEKTRTTTPERNYHFNTYGIFIQNSWSPSDVFSLETGLRGDYVSENGFELLPRISALWKPTSKLALRMGGGLGYKTPTIFTEEAERIQFRNILPIDGSAVSERSLGANFDINYRTSIGTTGLLINALLFYTRLNDPLILTSTPNSTYFKNAGGYIDTRGMETNLRITHGSFKLFIGYTLAKVTTHFNQVKSELPLTARHRLNNVLMYEVEDKWKLGLEAYYVSKQVLSDGSPGKPYWVTGFMAEKIWEKFSIFINFENFTDARQTRFDTIYSGNIDAPLFRDIYAPVDGFVINGGIKLRL